MNMGVFLVTLDCHVSSDLWISLHSASPKTFALTLAPHIELEDTFSYFAFFP